MKTCTVCKRTKPLDDFYNYKAKKDGKSYRCKCCDDLARKKWAIDNPETAHRSQRERNLRHKYGISLKEYQTLLEKQGYACAICGTTENKVVKGHNASLNFAVDHDHITGSVRGLLCNQCNRGLGMIGDTREAVEKVLKYLGETH